MLTDAALFDDLPDWRPSEYPVARRFAGRAVPRSTRYTSQLWEVIEASTEARRAMRKMFKENEPEIAAELKFSEENAAYSQGLVAGQTMHALNRKMALVKRARTLEELQSFAEERARVHGPDDLVQKLKDKRAWGNIDALKTELGEVLQREQNAYAKRVIKSIEGRKAQRAQRAPAAAPGTFTFEEAR